MKVIITMAGKGSRFENIGFGIPKHEIKVKGKTLFEWSLLSLKDFFEEDFILIVRKDAYSIIFIEKIMDKLNISNFSIVEIAGMTDGQASTVLHADPCIKNNENILIFNIDTYIEEYTILKSKIKEEYTGFIPAFKVKGSKWSFVEIDKKQRVLNITEKIRISEYGTVGIYYFKYWEEYKLIYNKYKEVIKEEYGEVYIAPMYKYLLEKKVYAPIIPSDKVHVLGTPEDIEKFDENYLQFNDNQRAYRKSLLKNFKFDLLDKSYIENLDSLNNNEILEYNVYLCDTGNIEGLIELYNQYDIRSLVNTTEKKSLSIQNTHILNFFKLYDTEKKIIFHNEISNKVYKMLEISVEETIDFMLKNKKIIFNTSNGGIHHVLMNYVVRKAIERKVISCQFYIEVLNCIGQKSYNSLRKKHIITNIVEYHNKYDQTLFSFGPYNHIQKMQYALTEKDYIYYSTGIKRIQRIIVENLKIKEINGGRTNIKKRELKDIKNNSIPKIALCISGVMRRDYKLQLREFKRRILDIVDVDVYIATWDKYQVYQGLSGPSLYDNALWLQKHFNEYLDFCPISIRKYKDFQEKLPNVFKKIATPITKELTKEDLQEVLGENIKIKFLSEKTFQEKYSDIDNIYRNKSLNQAKMFNGIYEGIKMIKESKINYNYIVRGRPDFPPYGDFQIKNLTTLEKGELASNRNITYGPSDFMFGGHTEDMEKLSQPWENVLQYGDLSPYESKGKKLIIDSHRLLEVLYYINNIIINPNNKLNYINLLTENKIPDVSRELEMDTINFSDSEKEEYYNFFLKTLPIDKDI